MPSSLIRYESQVKSSFNLIFKGRNGMQKKKLQSKTMQIEPVLKVIIILNVHCYCHENT